MKMLLVMAFVLMIYFVIPSHAQDNWDSVGTVGGTAFSFVADSAGNLFAGTWNAIYKSADDGLTWTKKLQGGTYSNYIWFTVNKKGHIFVSTHSSSIYKSTDNGESWTSFSTLGYVNSRPIRFLSNGDLLACTGAKGLFRSSDEGGSWQRVTAGFDSVNFRNIWSLDVAGNGDIFAGTNNYIYKSIDSGLSWVKIIHDSLCPDVKAILVLKNGNMIAGSQTSSCGIYKSIDSGKTWFKYFIGVDLANYAYVFSFAQSQANEHIFISTTEDGVYVSRDFGWTVEKLAGGFDPNNDYWWQVFITPGGHLLVGTAKGIYRSKSSVNDVVSFNDLSDFDLVCYPNPTNLATTIKYNISKPGNIKLEVFNLTGKRIKVIADRFSDAGEFEVVFDATGLEPGIYYYKLTNGSEVRTKEVVIVR